MLLGYTTSLLDNKLLPHRSGRQLVFGFVRIPAGPHQSARKQSYIALEERISENQPTSVSRSGPFVSQQPKSYPRSFERATLSCVHPQVASIRLLLSSFRFVNKPSMHGFDGKENPHG